MTASPRVRIPHHISEESFRRFEPFLTLAVARWPEETSWDLSLMEHNDLKISPMTFVARFRDAIVSQRRFGWQSTVDVAKLNSIAGLFCVSLQAGTSIVWFKHRVPVGRTPDWKHLAESGDVHNAPGVPSVVPWKDATMEEIEALCLLLSAGKLIGPFILTQRLDDAFVVRLQQRWNVAATWDETRKQTILL